MPFKKPALPFSMSLTLILNGCMRTTGSADTDGPVPDAVTASAKDKKQDRLPLVYCGAGNPFYWSAEDTEDTIRQAKIHNAKWRALCGPQIATAAQKAGA